MKLYSFHSAALAAGIGAALSAAAPLRASETDDRIESSAKKSYVFKTYLKNDSIKTVSNNGVVVLTGKVPAAATRSQAELAASQIANVQQVVNEIETTQN